MGHFQHPPRVELGLGPTRIERLPRLSQKYGVELFVKREDETGCLLSGNKVRKLEFLLREALDRGCDTVLTCGGLQSNHARATAAASVKLGLKPILLLRGWPDEAYDGNLLLDRLLGAEVLFVAPEEYRAIGAKFEEVSERARREGGKPYVIPEGGSNALGAFGYVRVVEELRNQMEELGLQFDSIVTAIGSGGTYAGLILGKKLYGLDLDIYGFNVCEDALSFKNKILFILKEAGAVFGLEVPVVEEEVKIVDGYVGRGYALSTEEELRFLAFVAAEEGLILDPVYTGKAFYGLASELEKDRLRFGQRVLFLHTGGLFGLFPYRRALTSVLEG